MSQNSNRFFDAKTTSTNIYEFERLMEDNQVIMAYQGEFSQDVTNSVLSFAERKLVADDVESLTRKKLFNVMVECLQNISKHAFKVENENKFADSVFMICQESDDFLVISSNLILNAKIESLMERLSKINELDKDGLKALFKEMRLKNKLSDRSEAGIGLIDMARKSGNKLVYMFEQIDDTYSYFKICSRVNRVFVK